MKWNKLNDNENDNNEIMMKNDNDNGVIMTIILMKKQW